MKPSGVAERLVASPIPKILIVVGTRPNIVKITRFRDVIAAHPRFSLCIVHTGQHFSPTMADVFFTQFRIRPDRCLGVAATGPTRQIAEMMTALDAVFDEERIGGG